MSFSRLPIIFLCLALCLGALPVQAQLAPAPRKAPRTPVKSKVLPSKKTKSAPPASRILIGTANVLGTEKILIEDSEVRLFGIVPPQMSAPLGPQTRAVLDALSEGTVTCEIRDRERGGTYLATCKNQTNADFGIELLRRGLAVAARGSLGTTEIATPYLAAEQAAQTQKLGLWKTKIPPAATANSIRKAAAEAEAAKKELAHLIAEKKAAEKKSEEIKSQIALGEATTSQPEATETTKEIEIGGTPVPQTKPQESAAPTTAPTIVSLSSNSSELASPKNTGAHAVLVPKTKPDLNKKKPEAPIAATPAPTLRKADWLEKHQIFATGLVLLLSAFSFVAGNLFWRRREQKEALRALAAALRGELLAARAIAKTRLSKWEQDPYDEKSAAWPRIRIIVFQAHVAKIGRLGAALARQLSSIYGQASDFASYYGNSKDESEFEAKQHALQTLLEHIEKVLPRLTRIEIDGVAPHPFAPAKRKQSPRRAAPTQKKRTSPSPHGNGGGNGGISKKTLAPMAPLAPLTPIPAMTPLKSEEPKEQTAPQEMPEPLAQSQPDTTKRESAPAPAPAPAKKVVARTPVKRTAPSTGDIIKSFVSPLLDSLYDIKHRAIEKLAELRAKPVENIIPDYANLTEEEMEALAEDYYEEDVDERTDRTG